MIETASMAGFLAAHGIWSVSEGETLIPIYAHENPQGERLLERMVADDIAEGARAAQQALEDNEHGSTRAVMVVDGVWSSVGSLNFDNRSLVFNNESNIVALDDRVGATLDSLFMSDLRYSKEIKLADFERRSWSDKLLEWGASTLQRVL